MDKIVALFVIWIGILLEGTSCLPVNCLHSRLDFFPCQLNPNNIAPIPNEFAEYVTFIRRHIPDCIYRNPQLHPNFEIINPINDLGIPNIRLLQSPGFAISHNYTNRRLVSYNVQCPPGTLPFLVFNSFDLQPKDCFGFCEDYVNISCSGCGSSESCGDQPTDNFYNLETDHFTVTFRTSELTRYSGFELGVTCFASEGEWLHVQVASTSEVTWFPGLELGVTYFIFEYPDEYRKKRSLNELNEDTAQVHREKDPDTANPSPINCSSSGQFTELTIHRGDVFNYKNNTIVVTREEKVLIRVYGIIQLETKDEKGGGQVFVGNIAQTGDTPQQLCAKGPGKLSITFNTAYLFQDLSLPITFTALEKEVLKNLTAEFFKLIPLYNTDRSKATSRPISTSALQLGISFKTSPNPVVRTASRSAVNIAKRENPSRVAEEKKRLKDKCSGNNGDCEHICIATNFSVQCSCNTGYKLAVDERHCENINECLINNGDCEQICTDTPGSRVCSCRPGYRASDGVHCLDIDECASNNGGCAQICYNTQGSYQCSCTSGYRASGTRCIDINECSYYNGGCAQICTNVKGSYNCSCRTGYRASGTRCIDINECSISNGGCSHICTNTGGSHRCSCRPGYRLSRIDRRSCYFNIPPGPPGPVPLGDAASP